MENKKHYVMLVGKTRAGKTTLTQYLTNQKLCYCKTQALAVVDGRFIDTPGEFLERKGLYGALSVTAAEADAVALIQSAADESSMFAPGFALMFFGKPVIGIVTKIDLADDVQLQRSNQYLKDAGADVCFSVSPVTGQGMAELEKWLLCLHDKGFK